jgi:hypothetical protein
MLRIGQKAYELPLLLLKLIVISMVRIRYYPLLEAFIVSRYFDC